MEEEEFSPVIQKKKRNSTKKAASAKQASVADENAGTASVYADGKNSRTLEQGKKSSALRQSKKSSALRQGQNSGTTSGPADGQNPNVAGGQSQSATDGQVEVVFVPDNLALNGQPVDLPKRKHGLKPFAFFAGIFSIVLAVALVAFAIMLVPMFQGAFSGGSGAEALGKVFLGLFLVPFLIVFLGILAIGALVIFVTGILTIVSSFVSDKHNWNAWLITAAVFDFLILIFSLLMIAVAAGSTQGSSWLTACIAVALLALLGGIFNIVDAVRTNARVKEYRHKVQLAREGTQFEMDVTVDQNERAQEAVVAQPQQSPAQKNTSDKNKQVNFSALSEENKKNKK